MNPKPGTHSEEHLDLVFLFALQAVPAHEIALIEAQISSCEDCQREIEMIRPIVRSFAGWPTDVLRPAESLWGRLAQRIATETDTRPFVPPLKAPAKAEWQEAAPGIHVKILARNAGNDSVSMGFVLIITGYEKLTSGLQRVGASMAKNQIPFPTVMGAYITALELVGGFLLLIGLGGRWLGLLYIGEFLVVSFDVVVPTRGWMDGRLPIMGNPLLNHNHSRADSLGDFIQRRQSR